MADDSTAPKVAPRLVAEIVSIYVAQNSVGIDQVAGLIATVHRSLSSLGESATAPVPLEPFVPIRRSVHPDYVVCLECGFRAQTLRRHLRAQHGLEVAQYRIRRNLLPDHPVTALAYSDRRSAMAKQIGLGRTMPQTAAAPVAPLPPAEPPAPPRGRGRPRRMTPN